MKSCFILAFLGIASVLSEDRIGFVYEAVRHGARAPQMAVENFPVKAGILTPSGMR